MSVIRLRLLGSFQVDVDGKSAAAVLAHSPKGVQLIQYLILNRGRMETTMALTQAMWPDSEASRPESALKTLVSRLRTLLQQVRPELGACLRTVRGGYQWVSQPGVSVDVEEFLDLAEDLRGRVDVDNDLQARSFRRMMSLYTGRLLQDQEQPEWMKQRAEALHNLYLNVVEEALQKLRDAGRMQQMVSICREALDADPMSSTLNMRLMDALIHSGRESEALQQYHHASELHASAANPAHALDEYYSRMLQGNRDLQASLNSLKTELLQGADTPGALVCDRVVFGELFRLEQRSLERTESTITLGVAMLTGLEKSPWQLDAAMTGLINVMVARLRRGDVITRLNATQVAFLLPHATEEDASAVADRLKRSFYLQFPAQGTLTFAFTPITLADESYVRQDEA
jgi:DNA-binding SARP family transcriptional activator